MAEYVFNTNYSVCLVKFDKHNDVSLNSIWRHHKMAKILYHLDDICIKKV